MASSKRITGVIIDAKTGKPVPYASVWLPNKVGAVADSLGGFTIDVTDNTINSFTASSTGYAAKQFDFLPGMGMYFLQPSVIELDPVVVYSKPKPKALAVDSSLTDSAAGSFLNRLRKPLVAGAKNSFNFWPYVTLVIIVIAIQYKKK